MDSRIWTTLALGSLVVIAGACTAGGEEIGVGGAGGAAGKATSGGSTAQGGSGGSTVGAGGMTSTGGSTTQGGSGGALGGSGGALGGSGGALGGSGGSVVGPTDPMFNNGTAYRFDMPCLYEDGGTPLSSCSEGEVCWVAENDTAGNPHSETEVIPIGGDPEVVYDITVRIRGIMEPKYYTNGCEPMFTRATNPPNETRSIYVCKATDTTSWNDTYNVWQLSVADPPQTFYLNADNENPGHRVNTIDGEFTFQARGATYIEMRFDDLNGGQIRNCNLTVPELAEQVFDGNFYQLDVLSWTAAQ
jgi:hypothetical protein